MNTPNKQAEETYTRREVKLLLDGCKAQAISEFKEKVRERIEKSLAEGIKRNNILPHDWAMDRIDEVLEKTAQETSG